jgi:CheY-like chemotaxis protein
MTAALSTPPLPRRARKSRKAAKPARAVLIAGIEKETAGRLASVFEGMGFEAVVARDYEETLSRLQEQPFALWVLDAASLRLEESIVWASLRFAAEGPMGGFREEMQPCDAARTPVVLLARSGDTLAYRALNAAATAPSITGWNREGWILGMQEVPFEKEDLEALTKELLAEALSGVAGPSRS